MTVVRVENEIPHLYPNSPSTEIEEQESRRSNGRNNTNERMEDGRVEASVKVEEERFD